MSDRFFSTEDLNTPEVDALRLIGHSIPGKNVRVSGEPGTFNDSWRPATLTRFNDELYRVDEVADDGSWIRLSPLGRG